MNKKVEAIKAIENLDITCNLGHKKNIKKWKKINGWQLYKCLQCGLVFLWPQADFDELAELYNEKYYKERDYQKTDEGIRNHLIREREKVSLLNNLGNHERVLDVGSGYGFFLKAAQEAGWQVLGIEISKESAGFATSRFGVKVVNSSLEDTDLQGKVFDVITMWDFLEHSSNANQAVAFANEHLQTGGYLIIRVPNHKSLEAKIQGNNWKHWDLPFHNFHFSPNSLKFLVRKNQFQVISVDYKFSTFIYNKLKKEPEKKSGDMRFSSETRDQDELSPKKPKRLFKVLSKIFSGRSITLIAKKQSAIR